MAIVPVTSSSNSQQRGGLMQDTPITGIAVGCIRYFQSPIFPFIWTPVVVPLCFFPMSGPVAGIASMIGSVAETANPGDPVDEINPTLPPLPEPRAAPSVGWQLVNVDRVSCTQCNKRMPNIGAQVLSQPLVS